MDKSGPAFPAPDFIVPQDLAAEHIHRLGTTRGMTLRQYAAIKAMQGLLAGPHDTDHGFTYSGDSTLAERAVSIADALLTDLAKDA